MGLTLTGDDVATLEARTEGWIAALQLAALSLQGRADATGSSTAFAGDDRYIVDYLVEEVLRRQPARIRDFLLRTSILSRFTGPLADAVTGGQAGARRSRRSIAATCSSSPSTTSVAGTAITTCSAACCRRTSLPKRPDEVADPAPPGERLVRSERRTRRGDRARVPRRRSRARGRARRARDPRDAPVPARARRCAAGARRIPRDVVARRPVLAVGYAGRHPVGQRGHGVDELLSGAEAQTGSGGG